MIKVPRCMSTQHPDNASTPFFSNSSVIEGETEVKEAFFVYSQLNCGEQMWDAEGKEVDSFVVRKLLSQYPHFFSEKMLGRDLFLTMRVPNPSVEKKEGKILLEALESIPRTFDSAKAFYGESLDGFAPIFEVILPMTTNAVELNRVSEYYKNFVSGKGSKSVFQNISVAEWVGDFQPKEVNVIPLVENQESMQKIDSILGEYLQGKRIERQRVFLARSDPALNYGSVSCVMLIKNALQKISELEEKTSIELLPIIGCGSAPFRGNLKPTNAKEFLQAYPSSQTFTLQSAFKYDYPPDQVREAISLIQESARGKAVFIDQQESSEIIRKVSEQYLKEVEILAPVINKFSPCIPQRRKRHLHIGLFGYSRSVTGLSLPRAITFCASLYSMGIPPDLLGLSALSEKDFDFLHESYKTFGNDLSDAAQFLNYDNLSKFPLIEKGVKNAVENFSFETNEEHKEASSQAMREFEKENIPKAREEVEKAAWIRKFLG